MNEYSRPLSLMDKRRLLAVWFHNTEQLAAALGVETIQEMAHYLIYRADKRSCAQIANDMLKADHKDQSPYGMTMEKYVTQLCETEAVGDYDTLVTFVRQYWDEIEEAGRAWDPDYAAPVLTRATKKNGNKERREQRPQEAKEAGATDPNG